MKEFVKRLYQGVAIAVSRFYNALPERIRIAVYVSTSMGVAGVLNLVIRDIEALEVLNDYLGVFQVAIIFFLTAVVNEIQYALQEKGQQFLAAKGDEKALTQLTDKLEIVQEKIEAAKPTI